MARIVKDYDDRLTEFLDVAQSLFFSKGYEQTSVQDIINTMGVAKGTFYHYFDAKVDLLDAVVKRTRGQILKTVTPIINDTTLNPIEKFQRFFGEINNWKLDNHAVILDMLRMLYRDENVLLRLKMFEESCNTVVPLLSRIIQEGVAEGMFHVEFAFETADMIMRMTEMPSNTLVSALLSGQYDTQGLEAMRREIHVFNRSIERVLGIQEPRFDLIKAEDLADWVALLEQVSLEESS